MRKEEVSKIWDKNVSVESHISDYRVDITPVLKIQNKILIGILEELKAIVQVIEKQ